MNFKLIKFALCAVTPAFLATSCNEEPEPKVEPRLEVTAPVVEGTSATFSVTVSDAAVCKYVCYESSDSASAHWDDARVLGEGSDLKTAVSAGTETITLSGLEYGTSYVLRVVAQSSTMTNAACVVPFSLGDNPAKHLGEPAYTYIVSAAGRYEFDAKFPDGSEVTGVVKADWIWATKQAETDSEQQLVSDVKYENGKISFTATDFKGNAVIAAFDAAGKSKCVWLIWCTDQPESMVYESGAEFMDRGVGATSANPADGDKTVAAIVYQWGRPVPIFGGYEDEWSSQGTVFKNAEKWTVLNPAYGYKWGTSKNLVTVEESFANPTTFFYGPMGFAWYTESNYYDLWGKDKTKYDPSPAGWQLPCAADWGNVLKNLVPADNYMGSSYTYNGKTAWFPPKSMGRMYNTGEYILGMNPGVTYWNGKIYEDWDDVDMGLATEPTRFPSRIIMLHTPGVWGANTDAMANQSFAFGIRCVKQK